MTLKEKRNLKRKWKRWLDKIGQYLGVLLTSYEVYEDVKKIVYKNKKIQKPALLHNWINNNYLHTVYTGIRRLGDKDKRTVSLYRLIEDIYNHNSAITRKDYISGYPKWMREKGMADADYNTFASKTSDILSKAKLKKDLKNIQREIRTIKNYTDKWIAHLDLKRKQIKRPTLKDIKMSLNCLDKIFCKYNMLITRGGMITRKPSLAIDWKESLRYPWIEMTEEE